MLQFANFIKGSFLQKVIAAIMASLLSMNLAFNTALNGGKTELDPGDYDNVILMIGDGMGFNHIDWMEKEYGIDEAYMFSMTESHGKSQTRSSNNVVTDSAAGATALSCAVRTNNGAIGVFAQDAFGVAYVPMNLSELAHSYGKMTGIVTSDTNHGATPGGFSAHVYDRDEGEEITRQQIEESDLDLIWSASSGLVDDAYANKYGWTLVDTLAEFEALEEGTRSFGQFAGEIWNENTGADSPNLSTLTTKAIDMLDDDEDGFFLMVEGAHIDKHSHSNEEKNMKIAAKEFDMAVKAAIEFAKADGNTLVVITADHETGAIKPDGDSFKFTSGSHSAADVPLLVYGSDNFVLTGEAIKNKEVSRRLAMAMGAAPDEFPAAVKAVN
ncbi:MAG: alkaline phosphatase [Clostridia bacterium]|nr:alkaline phosphatase [Clostridia bacterium]